MTIENQPGLSSETEVLAYMLHRLHKDGSTTLHMCEPEDAGAFAVCRYPSERSVPAELNEHLIAILGRPNFMCIEIARLLRTAGQVIEKEAEHEQAAVIHFLLGFYIEHGIHWWLPAYRRLEAIQAAAKKQKEVDRG